MGIWSYIVITIVYSYFLSHMKNDNEKLDTKKFYNMSTIGSDEVGTGDYFGPIVVTATYVSKEMIPVLTELGVRDSKKLNDDKIREIAPKIMRQIPYVTYILDNKSYNSLSAENKNIHSTHIVWYGRQTI